MRVPVDVLLLFLVVVCGESEYELTTDGRTRNLSTIATVCSKIRESESVHCESERGNSSVVLLGFLMPRMKFDIFLVGALPWAVLHLNENRSLGEGRSLQFCSAEAGSAGQSKAMRQMTYMRSHGVQAFFGPDESCMSEAMLASAWELPMISYKCSDKRVTDKKVFPTFARTMPPSSKISKFVVALLKHYKWSHIVVLVGKKPSWMQMIEALEELANKNEIKVTEKHFLSDDYTSSSADHKQALMKIADSTYTKTRVYVFVGENGALIDFARYMHQQGRLDKGEYVIISVDDETAPQEDETQYVLHVHEDKNILNESMVQPFRSVLKLTPSPPIDPNFKNFNDVVRNLSTKHPFLVPIPPVITVHVPTYAAHLYDAVYVYATALARVLEEGGDSRNVSRIMSKIFNSTYKSVQGFDVRIDENGDAEGNYTVIGLVWNDKLKAKNSMKQVAWFTPGQDLPSYVKSENAVNWFGGEPPVDEPNCGFDGSKCGSIVDWKIIVILTVVGLILLAAIFAFRHYRYEQKLACLLWKIDYKDISPITTDPHFIPNKNGTQQVRNKTSRGSFFGYLPNDTTYDYAQLKRPYCQIGNYKGIIVAIKTVKKRYIDLTRNIRKELQQVRELRHDNINTFIGAFVDHQMIGIVTVYSTRGSLEDVLKNKDLRLDNMFVATLVADLMRGMIYLHDSEVVYHGNLRSSNCLVDSRWVLQISDFGLHEFKNSHEVKNASQVAEKNQLWRAPELLREPAACLLLPTQGTQKGDVYSFGLITYHVVTRKAPWEDVYASSPDSDKAIRDLVLRIKNPDYSGGIIRPPTNGLVCQEPVVKCMQECWDEDPDRRPDFRTIRTNLKGLHAGLKPNIFDNMMAIMEKYAFNLEGIVQERTQQLMEEKKKTETLLHRMLPRTVAESLKRRGFVEAESFDMVTIYFSDIVGFTMLSAFSTPMQVVTLLNDLYTCFDKIIGHFGVYKVETIGDAYMVVSGLPLRNGDNHAKEIASMALALVNKIKNFTITHRPGETLKLRIGIHSGPCVAGVVGLKMPRYCLFGDTVNTASRMESTGEALKIHVSEVSKNILDKFGGFVLQERGFISVKGKGEMRTFWLLGKEPGQEQLIPPSLRSSQCDLLIDDSGVSTIEDVDVYGDTNSAEIVNHASLITINNNNNHLSARVEEYETSPSPTESLPSSPLLPYKSDAGRGGVRDAEAFRNSSGSVSSPQSFVTNVASRMMKKKYNNNNGFVSCSNVFLQPTDALLDKRHKKCERPLINGLVSFQNAENCNSAPIISYKCETVRQKGERN